VGRTFEKHPHLGGQSFPSDKILRKAELAKTDALLEDYKKASSWAVDTCQERQQEAEVKRQGIRENQS